MRKYIITALNDKSCRRLLGIWRSQILVLLAPLRVYKYNCISTQFTQCMHTCFLVFPLTILFTF